MCNFHVLEPLKLASEFVLHLDEKCVFTDIEEGALEYQLSQSVPRHQTYLRCAMISTPLIWPRSRRFVDQYGFESRSPSPKILRVIH